MGADDHIIDSWLEGQGGLEDARNGIHPHRRRSESSSSSMNNGPHHTEGPNGQQYGNAPRIETIQLDHTNHYPVYDAASVHSPTSPRTHHLPLLLQPTHHTHHGLHFSEPQSYTYSTSSSAFTSGASTPTASTVASSPRLAMDSTYNSFFPNISPTSAIQPPFSPTSPHMERTSPDGKPLVYIRLDPTNDLYKLYPMSTIAIMPWLNGNDSSMHDHEGLHQHLANLHVSGAGIHCLSPKTSTEQLPYASPHTYANPYAHFSPKPGNVTLDDMARRASGSWGGV